MTTRQDSNIHSRSSEPQTRRRRVFARAGATVAAVGLTVGIAVAASIVVTDTTDVRLRIIQSEFANGFDSGWHTHPGPVIVQVQEGTFKIYQGGCEPIVVHEGESYIEVPLVPVRAIAKGKIKWTTSQILPVGDAPQEPTVGPCE